jgi:hypothetical protein
MEARLSESAIEKVLDGGHSSLKWEVPAPSGFLGGLDLDKIAQDENCKDIVQSLPTQPLLFSLRQKGLAECLDILPHLTMDQFTRLLDYDAWRDESISKGRFYEWLTAFGAISKKEMATRFIDLEEEYQLSILVGKIRVFDEEDKEGLSEEDEDRLYPMPCNTVFFMIMSSQEEEIIAIENLIEAVIEENISYAYALISHAAFHPGLEAEDLLKQFRNARMGEDGFVSYDESLRLFAPVDLETYKAKWQSLRDEHSVTSRAVVSEEEENQPFLGLALNHAQESGWDMEQQFAVHQNILYVANSLCTAVNVEAGDVLGLNRVLEQVRARVGLGLECLAGGSEKAALVILTKVSAQELFRVGTTLVDSIRKAVLKGLTELDMPGADELRRNFETRRMGAILLKLDRTYRDILGLEVTEILKGLFNRFPMCPMLNGKERKDRVEFVPIDRMRLFYEIRSLTEGVIAVLNLVSDLAKTPGKTVPSLEKMVSTVCVHTVVKGEVCAQPLSRADLENFLALSSEDLSSKVQNLEVVLKDFLRQRRQDWVVTEDAIEGSLTAAMHIVIDSLVGVLLAAKNAKGSLDKMVIMIEAGGADA